MSGSWWRDPGYRRDALIVVGLFGLGLLFNVIVGVALLVLFDLLGLPGESGAGFSLGPELDHDR